MSAALPRAHGGAVLRAVLRARPEDFQVDEQLGFVADGEGEHALLRVEKCAANTVWVAAQLARWAGIDERAVGYAGLKDRHAVCRQSFSLHLPGRTLPEQDPVDASFRVLERARHRRKLQRGGLRGNRFRIRLRAVEGEPEAIAERLRVIAAVGVPNYFGEQRFGRDGGNLEAARRMLAGQRVARSTRSLLLSALRSQAFNQVLAARVEQGDWCRPVEGEVFVLAGSRSVFGPLPLDEVIQRRCAEGDIHPSGPLWGSGDLRTQGRAADYDRLALQLGEDLLAGLVAAGLRQERRALRLPVAGLQWRWDADSLLLSFELPAGCYATAVLHELGELSSAQPAAEGE